MRHSFYVCANGLALLVVGDGSKYRVIEFKKVSESGIITTTLVSNAYKSKKEKK